MKIKERKKGNTFYYLKRLSHFFYNLIINKKTKIMFLICTIIIFLLIGTFVGLIITGFFGTFDSPSERSIKLLHSLGFDALQDLRNRFEGIKNENVKIPINFIKAKLSKPKELFIDINFKNYQQIEYDRQQALEIGGLLEENKNYVPAKIRVDNKELNVRLRLKGDNSDHWEGDKWSLRIKVTGGDSLFGMQTFSIQDPKTRNYLNEWLYHTILKKEEVLALRYEFVEVIINGEDRSIYALEEHFNKQLIESNDRREGVIIKFNENLMWAEMITEKNQGYKYLNLSYYKKDLDDFYRSTIETFDNEKILQDPVLSKQFEEAKNLLEYFRTGLLKPHEVFDADKLAKYFAVNTLMGSSHGSKWFNIRFYYNPITSLLEPIGFDQYCGGNAYNIMEEYFPECMDSNCPQKAETFWWELIFRDKIFFEKYMQELERISEKSYLDNLFEEFNKELDKNLDIIRKDDLFYYFSKRTYYRNQEQIKDKLNPLKSINVYFQEYLPFENKLIFSIGNIDTLPLEVIGVSYNDSTIFGLIQENNIVEPKVFAESVNYQKFEFEIPEELILNEESLKKLKVNYKILGLDNLKNESVLPWSYVREEFIEKDFIRQKPITEQNISSLEFLEIDNLTKKVNFKKGAWILNQDIIIPKGFVVFAEGGTAINLINGSMILSYSNLKFSGTEKEPIKIFSSDKTGQGLAVLNANKISNLNYVVFENLKNPVKEGWELTGAITFHHSPFKFDNVIIRGMHAEDSLDGVNSDYEIKNSFFENCFSDCFDDDFGGGIIKDTTFTNCGGDCIDISGTTVNIENILISGARDKGVSAGEESEIIARNLKINETYIGIASKDNSKVSITDTKISDVQYGLTVYEKKPEYGPSMMDAKNIEIINANKEYIVEKGSELLIDDIIILNKRGNIYVELYPNG